MLPAESEKMRWRTDVVGYNNVQKIRKLKVLKRFDTLEIKFEGKCFFPIFE